MTNAAAPARHCGLLPAPDVLDRHLVARTLVVADDRHERHVARSGVLELLTELVRLWIDIDTEPAVAQLGGELDGVGARFVDSRP